MTPLPGTTWLRDGLQSCLERPLAWAGTGLLASGFTAACAHATWAGLAADSLLTPTLIAVMLRMARTQQLENRLAPISACIELDQDWRDLLGLGGWWLAARLFWLAGCGLATWPTAAPAAAVARALLDPAALPGVDATPLFPLALMVRWFATALVVMEAAPPWGALRACAWNLHAHLPAFLIAFGLPGLLLFAATRSAGPAGGWNLPVLLLQSAVTPWLATTTWAAWRHLTEAL